MTELDKAYNWTDIHIPMATYIQLCTPAHTQIQNMYHSVNANIHKAARLVRTHKRKKSVVKAALQPSMLFNLR